MKRLIYFLTAFSMLLTSCERRPFGECFDDSYALIPVKIDWSQSGFVDDAASKDPDDYVHRVSVRFFPKNGDDAFDRYLETNVTEGEIMVPVGEYSVIVFNESVYDQSWSDAIRFTDINDYDLFAANKVEDKTPQSFFQLGPSDKLIVEPPRLASWALPDFRVTPAMATKTRGDGRSAPQLLNTSDEEMLYALTKIVVSPLTYDVNVLLPVDNLKYTQQIMGHKKGFADKVFMASRQTGKTQSDFIFKFNGRKWTDADKINGTTEWTFRSFDTPSDPSSKHFVDLHVLMTDGSRFVADEPFHYEVTDQVKNRTSKAPNYRINIVLPRISLPKTEGGVNVGDWDDEDFIIQ